MKTGKKFTKAENPIEKLRKERNLTQEQFAKESGGFDLKTIRKWTNKGEKPTGNNLITLAEFFDVSTDYLLGITECRHVGNKEITEAIGLSEKAIEVLRFFNSIVSDPEDRAEHRKTIDYINLALEEVSDQIVKYKQAPENHAPVTTIFHTMMQYLLSDSSELRYRDTDGYKEITSETATFEINGASTGYSIAELGRNMIKDQILKKLETEREEKKWHPHD